MTIMINISITFRTEQISRQ